MQRGGSSVDGDEERVREATQARSIDALACDARPAPEVKAVADRAAARLLGCRRWISTPAPTLACSEAPKSSA